MPGKQKNKQNREKVDSDDIWNDIEALRASPDNVNNGQQKTESLWCQQRSCSRSGGIGYSSDHETMGILLGLDSLHDFTCHCRISQ